MVAIGRTRLTFVAPLTAGDHSTAVGAHGAPLVLSPAQRRVLVALCRPFAATRFATPPSNRELAGELFLGVETVKFHLHALYAAFGVAGLPQHRKRVALAQRALEEGVIAAVRAARAGVAAPTPFADTRPPVPAPQWRHGTHR